MKALRFFKTGWLDLTGLAIALLSAPLFASPIWASPVGETPATVEASDPKILILFPSQWLTTEQIYVRGNVEADRYRLDIYATPDCQTPACYLGGITGEVDRTPSEPAAASSAEQVQLAERIEGRITTYCEAYCATMVEWSHNGAVYQLTLKDGEKEALVNLADAAIQAGIRGSN